MEEGVITKQNTDPTQYWYLKRIGRYTGDSRRYEKETANGRHQTHIVEIGAYKRQDEEIQKLDSLVKNIDEILDIEA